MIDAPLVSIIIPVYNGANYVADAIRSALNQTYKNIEIIVVDDGSSDQGKTQAVLSQFSEQVVIHHKENGGVSSALNEGLAIAKGVLVNWLSHDDLLDKRAIETKVRYWKKTKEPSSTIIGSNIRCITAEGKRFFKIHQKAKKVNSISSLLDGGVNGCTLLIPKEPLIANPFDTSMIYMQDYDAWAKLIESGLTIIPIKGRLTYSRYHSQQTSNTKKNLYKADFLQFADRHIYPLVTGGHYKDAAKVAFCLAKKSGRYPFYLEIAHKTRSLLSEQKQWQASRKMRFSLSLFYARCISLFLRR